MFLRIKQFINCTFQKGAWAPILVFIIHLLTGFIFNIYAIFSSFDVIMHFLGGVAITYFFIATVQCARQNDLLGQPSQLVVILLIFLLTSTTTIFWEFTEWMMDHFLGFRTQMGIDDTMLDMFLGMLGGVVMIMIKFKTIWKQN